MTALERLDTQNAQLPRNYAAARQALEQTHAIDECKDWADKAAALASYARQAKDDGLQKMAMRIQGRAVRRAGELLREIEPNHTGRIRDGDDPNSQTRKSAADEAGMSERQRKTAIRVAGIPEGEFEERIESDNPPTVTKLAEREKDEQFVRDTFGDLAIDDKEAFQGGIRLSGEIRSLRDEFDKCPPFDRVIATLSDREKQELRHNLSVLAEPMAELMHQLGE